MITYEQFEKATGFPPENDDLERVNCPEAGKLGHWSCGWNYAADLPFTMAPRSGQPNKNGDYE